MTNSKIGQIKSLKQSIHNLKMRWPIGIRSIDDYYDNKLKTLEQILENQLTGQLSRNEKRNE